MAPPSPRRPGFSKRAQMGLFASYVVAVTGALLGLLLIVTAQVDPKGNAAIQNLLGDIFSPVSRGGRAAVMAIRDWAGSIGAYIDAGSKNKAMAAELKAARQKIIKGQADALQVERLKRTLAMVERIGGTVLTARLVSSTGASSRRFAILGAGAADGVAVGQPVLSSEGLVGRVVSTGRFSARILLIIDAENIVPVKRLSDGTPALAIGTGDGRLELRTLTAGANPFKLRDIFVTSGTGGVYRPDIPVAIASSQSADKTLALPLAAPARLDFGIVEQVFIEEPPPQASTLPRGEE